MTRKIKIKTQIKKTKNRKKALQQNKNPAKERGSRCSLQQRTSAGQSPPGKPMDVVPLCRVLSISFRPARGVASLASFVYLGSPSISPDRFRTLATASSPKELGPDKRKFAAVPLLEPRSVNDVLTSVVAASQNEPPLRTVTVVSDGFVSAENSRGGRTNCLDSTEAFEKRDFLIRQCVLQKRSLH